MNIIIDSNVLFSALIKNSWTRTTILNYNGFFLFPDFIFDEINKHKAELIKKSGMKKREFETLLNIIIEKVIIIPSTAFYPFQKKAMNIVKEIDPDDVIFIACALAFPDAIIWSDDKQLKNQNKIKVLNSNEIKKNNIIIFQTIFLFQYNSSQLLLYIP